MTNRVLVLIGVGLAAQQAAASSDLLIVEQAPNPASIVSPEIRSAIVETGYPWKIRELQTGMEFLLVPPGTFVMGSDSADPEAVAEEMPAHSVTLTRPFYLGTTEVTQAQWFSMTGSSPSYFGGRPNNPVERVSWIQAVNAGLSLGFRLPTEAEWEFACRGGVPDSRYGPLSLIAWWGNGFGGSSGWGTNPVATKLPNGFGLHDMIGNVWEYCYDFWGEYQAGPATDPIGPTAGTDRVARSGDWYWPALGNRAPYRGPTAPDNLGLASNGVRYAISAETTNLEDLDGDQIRGSDDNCPSIANPSQGDCDSDGIGDACEIAAGAPDANVNGVPDSCDCPGDLNASNTVDAEDLAYVLFAWGTDGGKTPEADITRDGTVDANDLSVVLGSWGPCP
jgi:formylglycine-generating enzyme required for sulfatase activity